MNVSNIGFILGPFVVILAAVLIFLGKKGEEARKGAANHLEDVIPPQDLTLIEGIGPKIARILRNNGITTFTELAASDIPLLEKLLKENGLHFVKPHSWPEQARLAGAGKIDELKALQEKLVAGK